MHLTLSLLFSPSLSVPPLSLSTRSLSIAYLSTASLSFYHLLNPLSLYRLSFSLYTSLSLQPYLLSLSLVLSPCPPQTSILNFIKPFPNSFSFIFLYNELHNNIIKGVILKLPTLPHSYKLKKHILNN